MTLIVAQALISQPSGLFGILFFFLISP